MFQVIDTLNADRVVKELPTFRRAFNYSRKLEPVQSKSTKWGKDWQYLIRKAK